MFTFLQPTKVRPAKFTGEISPNGERIQLNSLYLHLSVSQVTESLLFLIILQ